jgi:ectoine hydroxylase-related dioxygenase (phytanoyl-CoA dioxygenase family)
MTGSSDRRVPVVAARDRRGLSEADAAAFRAEGVLVVRGLLSAGELAALDRETRALVDRAAAGRSDDPWLDDYRYERDETGGRVPMRVEYVVDKSPACRALLGHPFVLRSVEALLGGDFVPTWDSMVWKHPGRGAAVPWHRDAGPEHVDHRPIFNVDFYLDAADPTNCVWCIPGSSAWPQEVALRELERLHEAGRRAGGFCTAGATPLPMAPGDVLFHHIHAIHGSPPSRSDLRRVIYYEFRAAETELRLGPHVPAYVPEKQRVLAACIRHRVRTQPVAEEEPYRYRGSEPLAEGEELASYRFPHERWWRLA